MDHKKIVQQLPAKLKITIKLKYNHYIMQLLIYKETKSKLSYSFVKPNQSISIKLTYIIGSISQVFFIQLSTS